MKKGIKPEASVLGQLLLMQNILINLPDENSILSFVCKGLEDIPGVKSVHFLKEFKNNFSARIIHFPIGSQKDNCGSLRFKLDNVQSFQVYAEYVQNFVFMIQIILMERNQRRLNNQHKLELEERVKERTIQLSNEIDEHKQAEQALIESEERFRKISENAPVLINSFDKDGRCLFWNEQCNKTFGWTIEEINEHEVPMELFYPDPAVCEEVISTVSSDPDGSFREWHPVTKDGKILSTMWANFSLHNGQVFSMGYDITEYKKIENDLRKSAEIFERWKSSNFIGILQSNAAGDVIDANDAILKMLGYSKQELTEGKLDWTKLTPTEFLQLDQKAMEEASEKGTWTPFEKEYFHKDGHRVPILIGGSLLKESYDEYIVFIIDLTEAKLAKQALVKSENKFKNILEYAPDSILLINKHSKIVLVNKQLEKMSNYSREELIGQPLEKLVPNRYKHHNQHVKHYLSNPKNRPMGKEMDLYLQKKDGSEVSVEISLASLDTDEGILSMAFIVDVSVRKQAEQALKESEEKFKNIFKLSPVIMTLSDIETGEYLDVNEMFSNKLGFTREEVIGMKSTDLNLFLNQSAREDIIRLFNEQGFILNHEFQLRRKSGSILYCIFSSHILELKDKKVMLTTAVDITERKQAEQALIESEGKLNALFTSLTEMVVMHELVLNDTGEAIDYRIIDCNKVFTEVTGIRQEDAIGKLASKVYQTDPPPYLEKYAKVALGGDALEFTSYYPPLDKHFMISVVSPQSGKFATITTDISDMMEIQEKVIAKSKEMENYLYITSHDLRTPLVNIQGFSQRLKKQADSIKSLFTDKTLEPEILHQLGIITDEEIPKTLSFVLSNIEKMDTLINSLLLLSRTGRVEMNIQKIEMNSLFAKILQGLDFQIKEAQCEIHIHPLPACYGDPVLLNQVFENLISNALKYSDSERALKITVDAKKIHDKVVYSIRDTGKGIAQKYLHKIWDVFYRIDPRSNKTGEGIGLSLVKQIAEKHKGKVWAKSEEDKGSVFNIELLNHSFTEV